MKDQLRRILSSSFRSSSRSSSSATASPIVPSSPSSPNTYRTQDKQLPVMPRPSGTNKETTGTDGSAVAKVSDKAKKVQPRLIKSYLTAYNVVSAAGWTFVLYSLVHHMLSASGTAPVRLASSFLSSLNPLSYFSRFSMPFYSKSNKVTSYLSSFAQNPAVLKYLNRASTAHGAIGPLVVAVQTLALLEVVHVALKWVRSPIQTTAMQVASRLFLVWGVTERFSTASSNPLYATMIAAWAVTEMIRYPFYATGLLGITSKHLEWARYSLFYILYPLGAGSEALLIFSTVPPLKKFTSWPWYAYIYLILFAIWWPGLYVMMSHMHKQRRRNIGTGFWANLKSGSGRGRAVGNGDKKRP